MIIKKKKDTVTVTFPEYCDMAGVEKDSDSVRQIEDAPHVEVSLGNVKEFDTSYFQMLLSMHSTFSEGKMIVHQDMTEESRELFSLYGLEKIIEN